MGLRFMKITKYLPLILQNICRPTMPKATSKTSVTSQSTLGSPGEESSSRGILSSLSSLTHSSNEPVSADSGHATLSSVGRRDSQGIYIFYFYFLTQKEIVVKF